MLFRPFVDSVGDGSCTPAHAIQADPHAAPPLIRVENIRAVSSIEEGLSFVFPEAKSLRDPNRAVLCTHNQQVDLINTRMLARLPSSKKTYYSADSIKDDEPPQGLTPNASLFRSGDYLHSINARPGERCSSYYFESL